MDDFLRGVLIGLTVAVPVGPMAILVIRKSLVWGWVTGLVFGAGIALADTTYAAIAAGGFATVEAVLTEYQSQIRVAGGLLLVAIGTNIWRSASSVEANLTVPVNRQLLSREFVTGYVLALSNPATILIFLAMMAGYSASFSQDLGDIPVLISGVFAGSIGWWALLTGITSHVRTRLSPAWIVRVNVAAGLIIMLVGVVTIASSV